MKIVTHTDESTQCVRTWRSSGNSRMLAASDACLDSREWDGATAAAACAEAASCHVVVECCKYHFGKQLKVIGVIDWRNMEASQ